MKQELKNIANKTQLDTAFDVADKKQEKNKENPQTFVFTLFAF